MSLEHQVLEHLFAKLQAQREDVNNLRNQAAIAAALSGLIATVFSTQVPKGGENSPFYGQFFLGFSAPAVLLLVCFMGSLVFAVLVVVGRKDFHFGFDAQMMLEKIEKSETDSEFIWAYAKDGEWYFKDNEELIESAQSNLWWAMVLGFSQIFPWLMML